VRKHAPERKSIVQTCPAKPIVVKAGNIPIKIYRGTARGYDLFTVAYYVGDGDGKLTRKRESFRDVVKAKQRANENRSRH
jgi:hypothetical protein